MTNEKQRLFCTAFRSRVDVMESIQDLYIARTKSTKYFGTRHNTE